MGTRGQRAATDDSAWHSQRLGIDAPMPRDIIVVDMISQRDLEVGRLFIKVLIAQWVFAVVVTLAIPDWDREVSRVTAIIAGTVLAGLPILALVTRPHSSSTRHFVAVAQMG